ncbi:MAG: hypothetical protein K9M08_11215 [Pirellula sp.]|jgi:predicted KAP-like P-loop ATPase|nr:hypothetical protein [Pirellula sp.]
MWSDNEAKDDFLNFSILASVIAETIKTNGDKPLSIGVSGAWGVGKSSTLELLAAELNRYEPKPLIVRFHPWRHQSQDNVRAAFAECIAREITKCEGIGGEIKKKAQSILKRANLIRIAGYGLGGALTLATGLPIGGFFSKGIDAIAGTIDGDLQKADIEHAVDFAKTAQQKIGEWFPEGEKEHSPYENIEKICEEFGAALELLDRRLIVLIDDLDRCLPETTIEALEAMRLYFFVPRTVFVIAADEEMLRLAVRKHFETGNHMLDESHLQSYYDKLIQIPFRIPSLTVPDVVIYLTLMFLERQPKIAKPQLDEIRRKLCASLGKTWDGSRITRQMIMDTVGGAEIEGDFESRVAMIERLAPTLVKSKRVGGNPRLIKRFMNSLSIHRALAKSVGAPAEIGEDVLAKILLLQRCGEPGLVTELEVDVLKSIDGRSPILKKLEEPETPTVKKTATKSSKSNAEIEEVKSDGVKVSDLWKNDFAKEWIAMEPSLREIDLRAAFHVSRGADQIFLHTSKLSRESLDLIEALRKHPDNVDQLQSRIVAVPADEASAVMNALVEQLRTSSKEALRDRLNCCSIFVKAHPNQTTLLLSVLKSIDPRRYTAAEAYIIKQQPWCKELEENLKGKLPSDSTVLKTLGGQG